MRALVIGLILAALVAPAASAQTAKSLFGAVAAPAPGPAAPLGSYAKGCLAGAVELPETGPAWQAMRLSRNRNWGHPDLIAFIERLGIQAQALGWPRLYVGDLSQPRGGPMRSGHRSHQIGLDADIWLRAPGAALISRADREAISSTVVVAADRRSVNDRWTPTHHAVIRAAARDGAVARIFVNAAIKQALCDAEPAGDRAWLAKVRPWWSHDSHFHVRLACPAGAVGCADQDPVPPGDGCGDLAWWFSDEALNPAPAPGPAKPPQPELTLADLPTACAPLVAR